MSKPDGGTDSVKEIPVSRLAEQKEMELTLLTASIDSPVPITVSDINRPGLAMAGFVENFLVERIQVIGQTEVALLESLTPQGRYEAVKRLLQFQVPCIVVAKGLELPSELIEGAGQRGIPVLRTPMSTTPFIHELTAYLDDVFAPTVAIHGSLVDVYGVGLLFTGRSGIGKSECALFLVERGHRIVADDQVILTLFPDNHVEGRPPPLLRHHLEVRGLGILNIRDLFGATAVRDRVSIDLVVELCAWKDGEEYDRLGLDDRVHDVLGVEIPMLRIPVSPGRDMGVLLEVAARNTLLKQSGQHAARRFAKTLAETLGLPPEVNDERPGTESDSGDGD